MTIRPMQTKDAAETYGIYRDAVRIGAAPAYSLEPRMAWVPDDTMGPWWPERVQGCSTWVAEHNGRLTGFITLRDDGHLDLFFVLPSVRGDGTAAALYTALLAYACKAGHSELSTHASLMARPFLIRRGWQVVAEETALRHGVEITRFDKRLTDPDARGKL